MRGFARTAADERVSFYGDVDIGEALSLDELRGMYDAVVLAVGARPRPQAGPAGRGQARRRRLGELRQLVQRPPDFVDNTPDLDTSSVVIIGAGNVAIDVARVLVKTPAEMAATDLPDYAATPIHGAPISDVYMVARRGPVEAKFTNVELARDGPPRAVRAAGRRRRPCPIRSPARCRPATCACARRTSRPSAPSPSARPTRSRSACTSCSSRARSRSLGDGRAEAVRFERTRVENGRAVGTGEHFEIACGLVVAAVGYLSLPVDGAPFDHRNGVVVNEEGRVGPGLYAAGWIKRGPTGVIGTNKVDGRDCAQQILDDLGAEGSGKPGREALEALLRARGRRWIDLDDWRRIEAAEIDAAPEGAPAASYTGARTSTPSSTSTAPPADIRAHTRLRWTWS